MSVTFGQIFLAFVFTAAAGQVLADQGADKPVAAALSGWAAIPSDYRHPGPVSGQFASGANGVTPPFVGQPIPGFSGMIPGVKPGTFFALPDNGYGSQTNSADFVIGFYEVKPRFKRSGDGTTNPGSVEVLRFVPFSDPHGFLDATLVTGGPVYLRSTYYTASTIPVDPAIGAGRLLTGADFDVESITRMDDGSFWVGEEFGPYLLHFDSEGRLLRKPVPHPVLRAPQNPTNDVANPANLPGSRGFEAMTRNGDGSRLYLTTEASINSEPDKRLLKIYEFETAAAVYTDRTWTYAKDSSDSITGGNGNATNIFVIGDMTHVADQRFIVIERDDFQGPPSSATPPRQKRLYLLDLDVIDGVGVLKKRLLVDLLNFADPLDIGGPLAEVPKGRFSFPLQSVESLTMVNARSLLVGLDNNYPGGNGRDPGTPDDTEIITLRFKKPLSEYLVY